MWTRIAATAVICTLCAGTALAKPFNPDPERQEDHGWLGVYLGEQPDDSAAEILGVVGDDSPAARAGLRKGDVVVRVNGRDVAGVLGLVDAIRSADPGETVRIDIERDGLQMSFSVELGERPAMLEIEGLSQWNMDLPGQLKIMRGQAGSHWPDEVAEAIKDIEGSAFTVQIECNDGEGTAIIKHDAGEESIEFDCDEMASGSDHMIKMHGLAMPHNFEFNIPEITELQGTYKNQLKNMLRFAPAPSAPRTQIRVASDGSIEVTLRKGDTELTLEFRDADDLEARRPDLYDTYSDLLDDIE